MFSCGVTYLSIDWKPNALICNLTFLKLFISILETIPFLLENPLKIISPFGVDIIVLA